MMRSFPLTWAALNVALAAVATYVLCNTDELASAMATVMLFH